MNIVIFAALYYPFKGGYVESIHGLATRLQQKGHNLTIFTCNTHHTTTEEIIDKISIIRISCWNPKTLNNTFPIPKPISLFRAFWKLRKKSIDIISTQTRFFPTSFLGFLFAKIFHIPTIHTERGSVHTPSENFFIYWIGILIDHSLGWLICRFSDVVIGVSNEAKNFTKHLGAKKPITIYNGIDINFWKNSKDTKKDTKNNLAKINLVFVGRLIFGKGVQNLLQALSQIKKEGDKKFFLTIIGDGKYKQELQKLADELGLVEYIAFVGEKKHTQIHDIFKNCDIFINPSYSEGLPRTILEAAASGLAIIATNVGGTKEIVIHNKTGLLIPPNNTKALTAALKKLMNNVALQENLVVQNRMRIEKIFDWENIVKQYIEIFNQHVRH